MKIDLTPEEFKALVGKAEPAVADGSPWLTDTQEETILEIARELDVAPLIVAELVVAEGLGVLLKNPAFSSELLAIPQIKAVRQRILDR